MRIKRLLIGLLVSGLAFSFTGCGDEVINENGEKLFKLVELVTDDKKFPHKKVNRIVGAIRVKEREKVS